MLRLHHNSLLKFTFKNKLKPIMGSMYFFPKDIIKIENILADLHTG